MKLNKEQKIFIAGFKTSAEGFNGEYPFEYSSDEEIWEEIKNRFKEVKDGKSRNRC